MEVFSNGIGGSRDRVPQLMKTEIQLILSFVSVRSSNSFQYTKKQEQVELWVVVDLSIDDVTEGHFTRRCPSDCILQDMSNGFTKVTWIDQSIPNKYIQLIRFGVGFGAQRWINAILRHCACLRAITLNNNGNLLVTVRVCLKRLAQRMTNRFWDAICLTDGHQWRLVAVAPGASQIMARMSIDVGEQPGVVLCVTFTFWTEATYRDLFNLLMNKDLWDKQIGGVNALVAQHGQ